MRRFVEFNAVVVGTSAVYTITDYVPCTQNQTTDCSGASFDNVLLGLMSLGVIFALGYMIKNTRSWSQRALGLYALLVVFVGSYGRIVALPRLFGFPGVTLYELRLLRAYLTWGTPLFVIGTIVAYRKEIRDGTTVAGGSRLLPDT